MMHHATITAALILGALALPTRVHAAETPASVQELARFLNDDTFIVAQMNVAALADKKSNQAGISALVPQLAGDSKVVAVALRTADALVTQLNSAGIVELDFIAGLGDINDNGGPLWVLRLAPGSDLNKVKQTVTPLMAAAGPWIKPLEMKQLGENTVLVGRAATIARYSHTEAGDRSDMLDPLENLASEGAVVASVFCPGPDFRRVVRELWPQLPGPLAEMRGELADEWQHLELAVNLPPESKPRVTLQSRHASGAEKFVKLVAALPSAIEEIEDANDEERKLGQQIAAVLYAIEPQQNDTRVTLMLPADGQRVGEINPLVGTVVDAALESSRRDTRFHHFKEVGLGILNYESAKKHLPASAAIRSKDGKPLLSWRVAILPYLDGGMDLYKEFRLDEPWDSPHNRTLIERMPGVYSDPDPQVAKLNREGKTTFVVPVAAETMFDQTEERTYKEITDGTSGTIMIVEVEPSHAVVWTKPEDWNVDVQDPMQDLKRDDRKGFIAAFGDGHIEFIPLDVDWKKVRGLLTKSGGELFDWP